MLKLRSTQRTGMCRPVETFMPSTLSTTYMEVGEALEQGFLPQPVDDLDYGVAAVHGVEVQAVDAVL